MKKKIDFKIPLVIFLISEKIDHEKFAVHTFEWKTFYKNYNISKVLRFFNYKETGL